MTGWIALLFKYRNRLTIVLLLITFLWGWLYTHRQYLKEKSRADTAQILAASLQATVDDIKTRQQDVAALDARYTKELADAKLTIENLQRDVDSGAKRLRLNATCKPLPGTTTTARVDAAARAEPTRTAERNYFTLRQRIETSQRQITGLQEYIKQQCLRAK